MSPLDDLNEQQRRAVEVTDGPILIIAGPGTGKTKTLTARLAYLLIVQRVRPSEIVALTFTNKAAREMRDRLAAILGTDTGMPKVCTFHALGHSLLQADGTARALASERLRQEIIRTIPRPQALKGSSNRDLGLVISRAKTSLQHPPDDTIAQLLNGYEAAMRAQNVCDFDDLLLESYRLLREGVARRPLYRYVLVDEFQDTSELQYELLKLLAGTHNLFVIGDPNQSIYAFRGASADMFDRFRQDFPSASEIDLTVNYRSRPEIVRLANAVFPEAPQLQPTTDAPGIVRAVRVLNEYGEAAFIIDEIEQAIGGSDMLKARGGQMVAEPRDFAVLYRTHRAAKAVQKAFAAAGIPYQIAGEGSPYERAEVQMIIAELRALEPSGGVPVHDLAATIAEKHDLSGEHLTQFLAMLVQFGNDLAACLSYIDDISGQEFYNPTANAVTLITIHASKGLEFERVFLIAAEEDILPTPQAGNAGKGRTDEEQRLFYVAATRAKASLTVLYAATRNAKPAVMSRFVAELPVGVLPRLADPQLRAQQRRLKKRQLKRAQGSLF